MVNAVDTLPRSVAKISIGSILNRSFAVFGRHFGPFFVVSLAFSAIIAAIWWVVAVGLPIVLLNQSGTIRTAPPKSQILFMFIGMLCWLIATALHQGAVMAGSARSLNGEILTIKECISRSFSKIWALSGISILLYVAIIFIIILEMIILLIPTFIFHGFFYNFYIEGNRIYGVIFTLVLYAIPIFFLSSFLCVTFPSCIIEERGVVASLQRSVRLTENYRWKIFGILAISSLIAIIMMIIIFFFMVSLSSLGAALVWVVFWLVGSMEIIAFLAIVVTVIYFDLVSIKEGVQFESVSRIFD